MGCLRAGTVANVVVPHPEYVQFAPRYGFQPDFCEAADPESKGVVEALVGYAQRDLVVPAMAEGGWADLSAANAAARAWCAEVNGQVHSEIAAVPAERLVTERGVLRPLPSLRPPLREGESRKVDRTGMVRFGSARYAVPSERVGQVVQVRAEASVVIITQGDVEIIRHQPVGPGEVALGPFADEARRPTRGVRPRTATELAFLGLGGAGRGVPPRRRGGRDVAPGGGVGRDRRARRGLGARGAPAGVGARDDATDGSAPPTCGRSSRPGWGSRSPTRAGRPLALELPAVPERSLSAYALTQLALPSISTTEHAVDGVRGPVGGRA